MTVGIYVRNDAYRRLGVVDDWQSLSVKGIFNKAAPWSIDLDASTWAAGVLDEAHGISIEYNGQPLSAGPIDNPKRTFSNTANRLVVTGMDDNVVVGWREAWPCAPDYTGGYLFPDEANDVRSGSADEVIKGFVMANCTPEGWDPTRAVPRLEVAGVNDNGTNVVTQARFDMVDELITATALAGGDIGWKVSERPGSLLFDTYEPKDVSSTVKFSVGLGNLAKYSYEDDRPEFNWCIVAGMGDGVNRTFVIVFDSDSIAKWGRIEGKLIDRRDTNDVAQLEQSGQEALAKAASVLSIEATINDTEGIRFMEHWGLGSRVTVEIDGITFTDVVREVDLNWQDADTPVQITALIGSPAARRPTVPKLFENQRANSLRIAQLQQRL